MSAALDPSTAEWLDAPGLAAWLEAEGHLDRACHVLDERLQRRIYRWRHEIGAVTVWSADEVLVALDVLLIELPTELWTRNPRRRGALAA